MVDQHESEENSSIVIVTRLLLLHRLHKQPLVAGQLALWWVKTLHNFAGHHSTPPVLIQQRRHNWFCLFILLASCISLSIFGSELGACLGFLWSPDSSPKPQAPTPHPTPQRLSPGSHFNNLLCITVYHSAHNVLCHWLLHLCLYLIVISTVLYHLVGW